VHYDYRFLGIGESSTILKIISYNYQYSTIYYFSIAEVLQLLQKAENSDESLKPPLFLIGALEDDTYFWIIPNSHKATMDPSAYKLKKRMLIKMMKGDILVCNGLILHAGYGYGKSTNIRYHMYLLNRALHLDCLYDVDNTSAETFKETTIVGSESADFPTGLTNEIVDSISKEKRKQTIYNKKRKIHLVTIEP
jgi:hypothetical protein